MNARQKLKLEHLSNAYRLIYAESDGIPGLIVDRYGDVLVLQSLTTGSEFWKEAVADLLLEETGLSTIYERSDADVRELEGLERELVYAGNNAGSQLSFRERIELKVNLQSGHKRIDLDQTRTRLGVRELENSKDVRIVSVHWRVTLNGWRRAQVCSLLFICWRCMCREKSR